MCVSPASSAPEHTLQRAMRLSWPCAGARRLRPAKDHIKPAAMKLNYQNVKLLSNTFF